MPLLVRPSQSLIVAAIALAFAAGCKSRSNAPVPSGDVAASLPKLTADDKPFDPASLKGKPSLVLFATPTCPYCKEEIPGAQRAAQSKDGNAVIVFLAGSAQDGTKVASSLGFTGPVLMDDGTLKQKYKIKGVPYTVVLKPDGTADAAFSGMTSESTLASALASAR